MRRLIHSLLAHPAVFEWQQRLCNNYAVLREHFGPFLQVKDKDILEIGCSTGICASFAVDMEDNRYTGIDIEPQYVDYARPRYPAGRFVSMDARELTFADDSFDVIMFVGALHHMPDEVIRSCFRQIKRVLRPDGVVLSAEPLFTPGKPLSNFLLRHDRGRHIRNVAGYRCLFDGFSVARQDYLRFSAHRFCSFVLKKQNVSDREKLSA